jgi:CO/xanthine dehydrogenase Mo-binding subunit
MMGNAAIQAAERARELLAEAAAKHLEVPKARLAFSGGRVFDVEDPDTAVTFREAVCLAEAEFGTIGTVGSYTPPPSAAKFKGGGVGPSPTYSYTASVVEVEVDRVTGWITVPRVYIAHDIGRALNPTLARGQVEGSVYMALGEALMEEQEFRRLPAKLSRALVHKFPSMLEYKSPTSLDMPEVITDLIEDDPRGLFGEGGRPGAAFRARAQNAIYDAVGVRIDEVPITLEKIVKALDLSLPSGPLRPRPVPRYRLARAARRPHSVGGGRRPRRERPGAQARRQDGQAEKGRAHVTVVRFDRP